MVYKSGQIFLPFCHNPRVWRTDGQTDRQTEFSSLDRVCNSCRAVKSIFFKYKESACSLTSTFFLQCFHELRGGGGWWAVMWCGVFVSPWMQAELERTAEEEAEHRAKQKEKAQSRSDDLAATFCNSTPSSTTAANAAAANAKAPKKPKAKASKPGK